eukprot:11545153-Alexandrium_andersonii.AAC.1
MVEPVAATAPAIAPVSDAADAPQLAPCVSDAVDSSVSAAAGSQDAGGLSGTLQADVPGAA